MMRIREIVDDDLTAILAMNNEAVPAVNPHDRASLTELLAMADHSWVVADSRVVAGVLVTFGPGACYASPNYTWLSERYDDFRYVDRIVISPNHQGRGLGSRLYAEFEAHARAVGTTRLLSEVNVEPANPPSIAFHIDAGWSPIADHEHEPGKVVRYFEKLL